MESGYWEDLERSRSMEGRGTDGEWILGGSREEQKHGRKRKGWRVDIGRIWRGAEAWKRKGWEDLERVEARKEKERMESGYRKDLAEAWKEEERMESGYRKDLAEAWKEEERMESGY